MPFFPFSGPSIFPPAIAFFKLYFVSMVLRRTNDQKKGKEEVMTIDADAKSTIAIISILLSFFFFLL